MTSYRRTHSVVACGIHDPEKHYAATSMPVRTHKGHLSQHRSAAQSIQDLPICKQAADASDTTR